MQCMPEGLWYVGEGLARLSVCHAKGYLGYLHTTGRTRNKTEIPDQLRRERVGQTGTQFKHHNQISEQFIFCNANELVIVCRAKMSSCSSKLHCVMIWRLVDFPPGYPKFRSNGLSSVSFSLAKHSEPSSTEI